MPEPNPMKFLRWEGKWDLLILPPIASFNPSGGGLFKFWLWLGFVFMFLSFSFCLVLVLALVARFCYCLVFVYSVSD